MKELDISIKTALKAQASWQRVLDTLYSSPSWLAMQEIRAQIDSLPMTQLSREITQWQKLQPYYDSALSIQRQIEDIYGPMKDITKGLTFQTMEWSSLLQASEALKTIPQLDFSEFSKLAKIVQDGFANVKFEIPKISVKELQDYCAEEKITPDTVAEAVETICTEASEEKFTIPDRIDKVKRTNWFFALTIIWMILSFLGKPVIDHVKDDALEAWGITQLWEASGVYGWIDQFFGLAEEDGAVSEEIAKASVEAPVGNVSKAKRDEILGKISAIRSYIAAAPQDENTGNLMTYLSDLEKDLGAKKYGLIFEEHREAIDEVLEAYTPVLTEEKSRFIDHGGEMNFLLEGDNLAALRLLEKTHRGRIDLIYIDPPYNTGNKDFVYDDTFVEKTDTFIHSKWLSFISERLTLAQRLLSPKGVIAISTGYQEVHNLMLICQEMFFDRNVTCVTVQTSGGKPNGGFNITYEYIVFITPVDFEPNASESAMNEYASPYHGMNLATFDQVQRPGQAYPIFVDKDGILVGCGKTLTERIKCGDYNGELQDFVFDYTEAPEGTVAIWPVTKKGVPCVWRLIPSRVARDWQKGYIKIIPQNPGKTKNVFAIQYLSDGIIQKIEKGELATHRVSENERIPTLDIQGYHTAGETIQTIWTDKAYYTANGGNEMEKILGSKKAFSYPKPLALINEIVQRLTKTDSIILDFFAGSGTTGHAVMKLNDEDDGKRRFILCTNNENGICEDVTYERLKRVMERDGYSASLKYCKIKYVPISERVYYEYADELLHHVRELVELENGVNFTGNAEIAIVLTDEELTDFIAHPEAFDKCHTLYLGHDILLTGKQEKLLQECGILIHVIPDYYYRELEG